MVAERPSRDWRGYLSRPEVRRDPLRLIARRIAYEATWRLRRADLERPRWVRIEQDLRMSLRPSDHVDRAIYLYGLCEFATARVFQTLARPGMTVMDIGAHVGQYTLLASRAVGAGGRVVAAEPQAEIRRRLQEHVTANHCGNVTVIPTAIADASGSVWLEPGWADGSNSGHVGIVAEPGPQAVLVECTTVDRVVEELGLTRLDLLKVDVEGAEPDVVRGAVVALRRWRPAIVFEVNDLEGGPGVGFSAPSMDALRTLGYEIFGVVEAAAGGFQLVPVASGDDPGAFSTGWYALNLVALHPDNRTPTEVAMIRPGTIR